MTESEKSSAASLEYRNLREEIQNRSKAQADLLKLHIGALTGVIGAALSLPIGPSVIVAAAVESSLLGCWYVNHAARIVQLGAEGLSLSRWAIKNALDAESTARFRRLLWWTFDVPAVFGLVAPVVLFSSVFSGSARPPVVVGHVVFHVSAFILAATLYRFYRTGVTWWCRLADERTEEAKQQSAGLAHGSGI